MSVVGIVRGKVRYPDNPEVEGHGGLQGGEDVRAWRDTFCSVGQAMTWCRKILDGAVRPRQVEPATHPVPATDPYWDEAVVELRGGDDLPGPWWTSGGRRTWHVYDEHESRYGAVVRTDWEERRPRHVEMEA